MFFCWFYWRKMLVLRKAWFMSAKFQRGISSRSLMVSTSDALVPSANTGLTDDPLRSMQITNVKKEYQSDEGLKELMMKLRGGNEKITSGIQASMIGRDLKVRLLCVDTASPAVADVAFVGLIVGLPEHDRGLQRYCQGV